MKPHEHGVFTVSWSPLDGASQSEIVCICGHSTGPTLSPTDAINRHAAHRVDETIGYALAELEALSVRLA